MIRNEWFSLIAIALTLASFLIAVAFKRKRIFWMRQTIASQETHLAILKSRMESGHFPYEHFNEEDGCKCVMPCCVRLSSEPGSQSLRCVCTACNEECDAIGRLGSIGAAQKEREIDWLTRKITKLTAPAGSDDARAD